MRLSEARDQYLASRQGSCAAATVTQDGFVTRRFAAAIGDIYVHNVTAVHVEKWFLTLRAEHLCRDGRIRPAVKATTFNYYYARVKAFAHYLQTRGLTRHDLMAHVRPSRVDRRERLQPSADQLWRMLDNTSDSRDRAILATAMNTGLRAGEIARLRVGDVNMEQLSIRAWVSKSRIEDVMPMTDDLAGELETWLTTYRGSVLKHQSRALGAEDCLFPARRGFIYQWVTLDDGTRDNQLVERGYSPDRPATKLHRVAQRALASIGLATRHEGIHTLRRSAARALFDRLVDDRGYDGALRVTSALLHHSNGSTTETYLGLSAERRTRDELMRGRSILGPRPRVVRAPLSNVRELRPSSA
jgi:integrase